ncbi:MAG: carbamoyl phosphate synthase large subunit [Candidatus Marinimicrobia bacterium]|nr:carbamoyl phosphate synthase large subunit [Candidatus Neomarinimicrobiota bacterium]|tara:strand:- start:43868 stop:47041 length:3174 start_codon:yes stop_codon:yes gene_type:complete
MAKRTDLESILIIGAGPIVIGQACEFDYSGAQACKALKEEGYRIILVNSNPATIMTDPDMADATYIEPLTLESISAIIEKEKPNALLPTVGGQTALNLTVELKEAGVLDKNGVELIGANIDAIQRAENREQFKEAMENIGIDIPRGGFAHSINDAKEILLKMQFPIIIRPSFTLGGTGGAIAYNNEEFLELAENGLESSPITEVLIEESLLGWKEFELEVIRDNKDNVIIICSIENLDPMGIHTGDSITVAPAQTLSDYEYQKMRNWSIDCIRAIGVDTGGSNIQFAVNPTTGRIVIIEMNPRVSRSSALASKATGFPIAKIAAKLAVGYTLDELPNDITGQTLAAFEPTIDYVVTKVPRWDFEKFPSSTGHLGIQMQSVGEAMSIGRTFRESLQKAFRSLEVGLDGLEPKTGKRPLDMSKLRFGTSFRLLKIREAFLQGKSVEELQSITQIDPWFLRHIAALSLREKPNIIDADGLRELKQDGFSDKQIARMFELEESKIRELRKKFNVIPTYKVVDTCAAEFKAQTPYCYSTYEEENEISSLNGKKVIILGGGPNRIGQGIEFDYCCVQSVFAAKDLGWKAIMVNCNPETVSTDFDITDRLYFEPVTFEDVMNIVDMEKPNGILVQFGGQTPLNIAKALLDAGAPILGTSPDAIDLAEDRKKFGEILDKLGIPKPEYGTALSQNEAIKVADRIGYPVLVRPSYVLGGRAMEIVYDNGELVNYVKRAAEVSPEHPILIDAFLEDAFEFDVDAICDGEEVYIAGVMEHIEEAGIHSGDSSCVLPPNWLASNELEKIKEYTQMIALELGVKGLINIQFAGKDGVIYVLEANPRASRTIPFVSKATNVPLAKIATSIALGKKLSDFNLAEASTNDHVAVKKPVFPFNKFPQESVFLGPEMKSTGEVMGMAPIFGDAFAKAMTGDGHALPSSGSAFISVNENDKIKVLPIIRDLAALGFTIVATEGTANICKSNGIKAEKIFKVGEGRPNVVDEIKNGNIVLVVNTPLGSQSRYDEYSIGRSAIQARIPLVTTLSGALAVVRAIRSSAKNIVRSIQEIHG